MIADPRGTARDYDAAVSLADALASQSDDPPSIFGENAADEGGVDLFGSGSDDRDDALQLEPTEQGGVPPSSAAQKETNNGPITPDVSGDISDEAGDDDWMTELRRTNNKTDDGEGGNNHD